MSQEFDATDLHHSASVECNCKRIWQEFQMIRCGDGMKCPICVEAMLVAEGYYVSMNTAREVVPDIINAH